MTESELKILTALVNIIPQLSEIRKERLLGFAEGAALMLVREQGNADKFTHCSSDN